MEDDNLCGIITDGDVRRAFDRFEDITAVTADMIMTRTPKTIADDKRFAEAEQDMLNKKINSLVVTNAEGKVVGVLQIYDVNRKG